MRFLTGFLLGVICVPLVVVAYFRFGCAPAGVREPAMPFEKAMARAALHARVGHAAATNSPVQPTESNLMAGARAYRTSCAVCHSLPGKGATDLAKGMYPRAPQLLTGKGVTDDPVGVTHWVVENGIRLTGMPSFAGTLSGEQIWQVSLLLARAHELPPSVQQFLARPDTVPIAAN